MPEKDEPLTQGWCRDARGALRRETIHQKLRRCLNWDYKRPGSYAITLTLADRTRDWLGRLVGGETVGETAEQARPLGGGPLGGGPLGGGPLGGGPLGGGGWSIELTALGEVVARCWRELATNWPGVEPREFQIMPEHFHGILRVTTAQRHPLGQIIGSFKARATAAARALAGSPVPASLLAGNGLFSPGLHDTILWDLKRYRNERAYLFANPERLAIKRAHPDLFKVRRDLAVPLGGGPLGVARFSAIGNHFLLQKILFQVQCSRSAFAYSREKGEIVRDATGEPKVAFASPSFDAVREAALAEAARGSVLISPCVSDGERQIAREALAAGLPLITMQNKGFAPLQKPSGRYFDACSAGRLLMLAPAAWPYVPGKRPMTREDATAMNRICQWLAADGAATISYHGLSPADIDAIARSAALITG